jgi:hypothetical protein
MSAWLETLVFFLSVLKTQDTAETKEVDLYSAGGMRGGEDAWTSELQKDFVVRGSHTAYHVHMGEWRYGSMILDLGTRWSWILPAALWPWGKFNLLQKSVSGIFMEGKAQPARKIDNVTATCKPVV